MPFLNKRKYQKVLNQLKLSKVRGETWIDAGCGYGTYTLPLSTLVTNVIAIDRDQAKIDYLKSKLPLKTNIECYTHDFNFGSLFNDLVDGILFAYSLHYQTDPTNALVNAHKQIKNNGTILVIDYDRETAVPWVPYPLSRINALQLLKETNFKKLETVYLDERIFIVQGLK